MSRDLRATFYQQRFTRLSKELPEFNADVTRAVVSLSWLHDAVAKQLNTYLSRYDLSTASFNVLAILDERSQVPLNELGTLLIKTAANVTGLVDGLARRDLVRRVPHPEDRRVKLAELSPTGRALIKEILPGHHALMGQLFGVLDGPELTALTSMIERVLSCLPDQESPSS